jgi:hypothetical protein
MQRQPLCGGSTMPHLSVRRSYTPQNYVVYGRQLPILIDLVHEFCFNARRAIERTEKCRPGINDITGTLASALWDTLIQEIEPKSDFKTGVFAGVSYQK